MKGGTLAVFAFIPNFAALHFHQAPGDVQAQAGARHFTGFWILGTEEFLENFLLILNIIVCGLIMSLVGLVGYFIPAIRNAEDLLPDHEQAPVQGSPSIAD
jgi:hypothetical protein